MKPWLHDSNTEIYSTYNKGKFHVAERFSRTLANQIFNHMTLLSKNISITRTVNK